MTSAFTTQKLGPWVIGSWISVFCTAVIFDFILLDHNFMFFGEFHLDLVHYFAFISGVLAMQWLFAKRYKSLRSMALIFGLWRMSGAFVMAYALIVTIFVVLLLSQGLGGLVFLQF